MKYVLDIINVYNALLNEYTMLLDVELTSSLICHANISTPLKDLNFDKENLIRVLTVVHPRYDSLLLSYLEGSLDYTSAHERIDIEPFRSLFPLIVDGGPSSSLAVEAFRQLAVFGKKLKAPCGDEKDLNMINRLFFTDKSLPLRLPETPILRLAKRLITHLLGVSPPVDILSDCSHGSGSSADEIIPPWRWDGCNIRLTPELHCISDLHDMRLESVSIDQYESRVLLVPKDARGPRVICCEHATLMAHQQSARKYLHKRINTHELSRGRVNLLDQKINQKLAYIGSLNRSVATIDMAEASDRVSLALVNAIFPPLWRHLLKTLRSKAYRTDYGTRPKVTMRKYAPMGSALCFPVETLAFWAVSSAAIARHRGCRIEEAATLCTVHGDDTIVPTDCAEAVIQALEACALKVNTDKSFIHGFFRESCGGDYFLGHDVTPVRHNELWDSAESRLQQLIILRNGFYKKGLWSTAQSIESMLKRSVFTTHIDREVANTRVTMVPAFVGGTVLNQSKQHRAVFSCLTNQPKKYSERPGCLGRYIQYWAERPNISSEVFCFTGGNPSTALKIEEWTGAHTISYLRKKGKIVISRKTVYTQRGECLKRARVEIDLQPLLVNNLKSAGYFAPIVK